MTFQKCTECGGSFVVKFRGPVSPRCSMECEEIWAREMLAAEMAAREAQVRELEYELDRHYNA